MSASSSSGSDPAGPGPTAVRRALRWIGRVVDREGARRAKLAARDPWERLDLVPPPEAYGPGATSDFTEYLARDSRIWAPTPAEVATWLLSCAYAEDDVLLGEADLWLHPCTFELVRSGDCEDFALWAWRKLLETGHDAEFVVGLRRRSDGVVGRHAWTLFRERGAEFLLDGVERSPRRIIRPVADVRDDYEPQVGVGADGRRFVFAGFFRAEWSRQMRLRARRR
jgi:hypothetical protein